MWVRKRIDIGMGDLAYGIGRCLIPSRRMAGVRRLEERWSPKGDAMVCLSVRSGFDLLLDALRLPPGSEVLVSAVTISDMVRIIEHHGLVAVPLDLEPATMAPTAEGLARATTPATKAVLVAHLFGGRVALEPLVDIARQRGLLIFEDCAQAFDGGSYRGHPEADASMFSFGPIKSGTALGGAVLRVRDRQTLARMRRRQSTYPVQSGLVYLRRLLKYVGIKTASIRPVLGLIVHAYETFGWDYDRLGNSAARGFAGPGFFDRIRRRPSAPLVAVLERRLQRYRFGRLAEQRRKAELMLRSLGASPFRFCPGVESRPHTFWVFPIVVQDPDGLIRALRQVGFDATQGQSLAVVPPPADRPESAASVAGNLLRRIVYLPFYPEMPEGAIRRMAAVVRREAVLVDLRRFEPVPA